MVRLFVVRSAMALCRSVLFLRHLMVLLRKVKPSNKGVVGQFVGTSDHVVMAGPCPGHLSQLSATSDGRDGARP